MNARRRWTWALLALAGALGCSKTGEKDQGKEPAGGGKGPAAAAPAANAATALPTGPMTPVDLAADDQYLYWTNSSAKSGTVVRSSHDGKTMGHLAKDEPMPAQITTDATHVWWRVGGGFVRSAKTGGGTEIVAMTDDEVGDIAAADGKLYYTALQKGDIVVVEPDKMPEILVPGQNHPLRIAVDAQNVYWTTTGSGKKDGTVMKAPRAGGAPVKLAGEQWLPDNLVIDGRRVYWSMPKRGGNAVLSVTLDGIEPLTLAQDVGDVKSLAVDASYLYIGTQKAVKRVPRKGGPVEDVVPDTGGLVSQLVLDATHLFWNDYRNGKIMTARKLP